MTSRPISQSAMDSFDDFTVADLCTFTPRTDALAQAIGFPRFARPCDDTNWDGPAYKFYLPGEPRI